MDANRPQGPHNVTFSEARERFLEAKSHLKKLTVKTYSDVLRWLGEELPPNLRLRDLGSEHLKPFIYASRLKRASQRKHYTHLRAFFKWCVGEGGLLEKNPLEGVPQPKPERKLPEYLTTDELERLLRAIRTDYEMKIAENKAQPGQILWLEDAIQLGVTTGMRREELCSLQWRDVDFVRGAIYLRHSEDFSTKSDAERPIPIVKPAREVLEKLASERMESGGELSGPVLRGATGGSLYPNQFTRRFAFYRDLARLDSRFSPHSLRHTCASWLLQNGCSLEEVGAVLGHTDTRTTKIYAHLAQDKLKEKMERAFDSWGSR